MIYIDALRIVPRNTILRFKNTFVISYSLIPNNTLIKSPEAFLTGVSIVVCVRFWGDRFSVATAWRDRFSVATCETGFLWPLPGETGFPWPLPGETDFPWPLPVRQVFRGHYLWDYHQCHVSDSACEGARGVQTSRHTLTELPAGSACTSAQP